MNGKDKCKYLRDLRIKIAQQYGIEYTPHECHNTEPCSGTCEMCESELRTLNEKIWNKLGLSFDISEEIDSIERGEEHQKIEAVYNKRRFSNPFALRGYITKEE